MMVVDEEIEMINTHLQHEDQNPVLQKLLLDNLLARRPVIFRNLLERDKYNNTNESLSINIDYTYPHPISKSLLDIACCEGLVEFVKILLDFQANPNKINKAHNRAPIHFATESGHVDVLQMLLDDPRTNPSLEVGRETALHFSVRINNCKCAKVLLDKKASPNVTNAKGLTPIHSAAIDSNIEMVNLILNHAKLSPDLDNFWDFKKRTARHVIMEKFPDINLPPFSAKLKKIDFNGLRFYLDTNDEDHFLKNLEIVEPNELDNDCQYIQLIMIATEHNFLNAVKALIKMKKNHYDGDNYLNMVKAAECAIKRGNCKILAEFLTINAQIGNELLLTACQELGVPLTFDINQSNRLECLKMILNQPEINVRCEDDKGNTPLHYAARADCEEAVKILLRLGSYIGHRNVLGILPLSDISPHILQDYFDECLQCNNDRTDNYEIKFNYQCLIPHHTPIIYSRSNQDISVSIKNDVLSIEMEPLQYIAKSKSLRNLLTHPLISSFLYLKWYRIRHFLYINFIFYILFYFFINIYILLITYRIHENNNHEKKTVNTSNSSDITITTWSNSLNSIWTLTAIFSLILLVREIFQLISSPQHYIAKFENWLEIILITLSFAVLAGATPPIDTIVILLSAWELIILIGQHPHMSIGIEMFKTVSINLIYFILSYAFLIVAFALAFFTLFKNNDDENFPDPAQSLFKTIVMLTGEFEASDIPFISHPIFSHLIFILFVFFIAIVLFNLLIGLAVSDTADILGKSELVGFISRTQLVSYAERIMIKSNIPFTPKNNIFRRSFNLEFLSKRTLLFPYYLPFGKLTVKPYKANEIHIPGNKSKCSRILIMDKKIVSRAKEILSEKRNITSDVDNIMTKLDHLLLKFNDFQLIINNIERSIAKNDSNSTL